MLTVAGLGLPNSTLELDAGQESCSFELGLRVYSLKVGWVPLNPSLYLRAQKKRGTAVVLSLVLVLVAVLGQPFGRLNFSAHYVFWRAQIFKHA